MSIKIMSLVWEKGPENQTERFVLLALADFANDAGECWPSVAGICSKVCMSERGVQTAIRRLEAAGWVSIDTGKGRKNCNVYTVKIQQEESVPASAAGRRSVDRFAIFKRDNFTCVYCGYVGVSSGQEAGSDLHVDHVIPSSKGGTDSDENLVCACGPCNVSKGGRTPSEWVKNPARNAPRTICPPQIDAETPHITAQNPARNAPEPSRTVKEPSIVRASLCAVMKPETADAWIAHRKAKRATMTPHAAELIAKKLAGRTDADDVVLHAIAQGWTGIYPPEAKPSQAKSSTPTRNEFWRKVAGTAQ